MSKFKVGDKVNYIGHCYTNVENPCTMIQELNNFYQVKANDGILWSFCDDDIEPLEVSPTGNKSFVIVDKGMEINEQGGKGSYTGTRMDLIPAKAIIEVGKVMYEGAQKYEIDNWRKVDINSHINHALKHLYEYLRLMQQTASIEIESLIPTYGEVKTELAHATTRLLMALELII